MLVIFVELNLSRVKDDARELVLFQIRVDKLFLGFLLLGLLGLLGLSELLTDDVLGLAGAFLWHLNLLRLLRSFLRSS